MKRTRIFHRRTTSRCWLVLVVGTALLVSGAALSQEPGPETASQRTERQAVAALKELGARVTLDDNGEVLEVQLRGRGITDAALDHIKGLTKIQRLDLRFTRITNAGLEHLKGLTSLQTLRLRDTQVTDAGMVHLKGLTNLEELDLQDTQVTDAGLAHLEELTELQRLDLEETKLTDAGLVHLKGLSALQELDLAKTKVSGAGLVHLKGLTGLEELDFEETGITDAGLVHLRGLRKLQGLDLTDTQVTDAGLAHLKDLTNLQRLELGETHVTDAGLVHLEGLTKLDEVYLEGTQVTQAALKRLQAQIAKPVRVEGIVRDLEGRGVDGALVAAVPSQHWPLEAVMARSSAGGRFHLELLPGRYTVTATAPGLAAARYESDVFDWSAPTLRVRRGDPITELILTFERGGFTVSGRVTDASGRPLPNLSVFACEGPWFGAVFYVNTDALGRHEIRLPPRDYHLGVHTKDFHADSVLVSPETTNRVDLKAVAIADLKHPAPQEVVAWVKQRAIPLETPEPGHGVRDLLAVKQVIGNARIVGLGEATHGTREFFQIKHRMLEFLVSEMGFTVFAIESSWPESIATNDYVLSRKGDPPRSSTRRVEWMRRYNADPKHKTKVKFYGFDMQYTHGAVEKTIDYFTDVDPDYASRAQELLASLKPRTIWRTTYRKLSEDRHDAIRAGIAEVLARLTEHKDRYITVSGKRKWLLARQHIRMLSQADKMWWATRQGRSNSDYNIRDRSMAENIQWIANVAEPDSKVMVWAGNNHIARENSSGWVPMGTHLERMFGKQYVNLGFVFNRGSFRATDWTNRRLNRPRRREFTVGPAPKGSIEATLARAQIPLFVLDLRDSPKSGPVAEWLSSPRVLRSGIGSIFVSEGDMLDIVRVREQYDGLIFVDTTTAARPYRRASGSK